MVVSINRNSKVFDKNTTDELNSAFYKINQAISNYKSEPLQHKAAIQYIDNSNSFIAENILCIRETFKSIGVYSSFTKILDLPRSVPYDVWTTAVSEGGNIMMVHIKEKSLSVYGTSLEGEIFHIILDVVLPNI